MPQVPDCVGTYELDHPVCNGDPDPDASEQDRAVCAWRDRCRGLQLFCREFSHDPASVVASYPFAGLVSLTEAQIEKHDIRNGQTAEEREAEPVPDEESEVEATEPEPRKPPTPRKPPKRSRATRKVPSRRSRKGVGRQKSPLNETMLELAEHFEVLLRDLFPERTFATGNRVVVKPGVFYPVDRVSGSHYISWYCTSAEGSDHALACIRFKPRLGVVDIGLPVEQEELRNFLGVRTYKRLSVKPYKTGQFRSLASKLDTGGVGLVVEVLKRLIEADIIALPEGK